MAEENLRAAVGELGAVLAEIVIAAEKQAKLRCPYKTTELLCTFDGGCQNRRREGRTISCGGDELLARGVS